MDVKEMDILKEIDNKLLQNGLNGQYLSESEFQSLIYERDKIIATQSQTNQSTPNRLYNIAMFNMYL